MTPSSPNVSFASNRKKRSRATWIVVLSLLAALALTAAVLWQGILEKVHSTRPQMLVAIAVATWAATALVMYLWRVGSLMRARRRARRDEEALFERLQRDVEQAVSEATEFAVVTTEWAVRAELVRDDVEDIQEYMQRLVKRPRVRRALVARPDGTVVGAGDRKQRGLSIKSLVPKLPAESSSVQRVPLESGATLFVVPVMGLESRLGTLVLELERPALARDVQEAIG